MTRRSWVFVGVCLRIAIVVILIAGFLPMIEPAVHSWVHR
jgi:FlaG/FlaF family flagellin (archaellin)